MRNRSQQNELKSTLQSLGSKVCSLEGDCSKDHVINPVTGQCVLKSNGIGAMIERHKNAACKSEVRRVPVYADEAMAEKISVLETAVTQLRPLASLISDHGKSLEGLTQVYASLEKLREEVDSNKRVLSETVESTVSFHSDVQKVQSLENHVAQLRHDFGLLAKRLHEQHESYESAKGLEDRMKTDMTTLGELRAGLASMLVLCKDELRKAEHVAQMVANTKEEVANAFKTVTETHASLKQDFESAIASSEEMKTSQALFVESVRREQESMKNIEKDAAARIARVEESLIERISNAEKVATERFETFVRQFSHTAMQNIESAVQQSTVDTLSRIQDNEEIKRHISDAKSAIDVAAQEAIEKVGEHHTHRAIAESENGEETPANYNHMSTIRAAMNEARILEGDVADAKRILLAEEKQLLSEQSRAQQDFDDASKLRDVINDEIQVSQQIQSQIKQLDNGLKSMERKALSNPQNPQVIAQLQDAVGMRDQLNERLSQLHQDIQAKGNEYDQKAANVAQEEQVLVQHIKDYEADKAVYEAKQKELLEAQSVIKTAELTKFHHTERMTGQSVVPAVHHHFEGGANASQIALIGDNNILFLRQNGISPNNPKTKDLYLKVMKAVHESPQIVVLDNEFVEGIAKHM
jgi:hypothetical protein